MNAQSRDTWLVPRDLSSVTEALLRRATADGPSPTIAFYERRRRGFRRSTHRQFLRETLHAAQRLRARPESNEHRPRFGIVDATSPEGQLRGYLISLWLGIAPTILPTRPMADRRSRAATLDGVRASLPVDTCLITDRQGAPESANGPLLTLPITLPEEAGSRTNPFDEVRCGAGDDIVHVQMSSGSTGASKAIPISHANLLANCQAIERHWDLSRHDRVVTWLPLYHDMGLVLFTLLELLAGIDLFIMSPFDFLADPTAWFEALASERGTITGAPNFALDLCVKRVPPKTPLDLSTVRIFVCGGEPVSAVSSNAFLSRFDPIGLKPEAFSPSYGLAEATLAVTSVRHDVAVGIATSPETGRHAVSCGAPLDTVVVRVVDPKTGAALAEGTPGLIVVEGPSVSPGYLTPEGNPEPFAGGVLNTGDIGFMRDGELYVVDRSKNIIIRHGENFSAHDSEEAIATIVGATPADVMVVEADIGDPDSDVVAVVELGREQSVEEVTQRFMAGRHVLDLPVDELVIVGRGGLPTTTSGKKQHIDLRRQLADGSLRVKHRARPRPTFDERGPRDDEASHAAFDMTTAERSVTAIRNAVLEAVRAVSASHGTSDLVCTDAHLVHDLGLGSLDLFELAVALEDVLAIAIPDETVATLRTVADLVLVCQDALVVDLRGSNGLARSLADRLPQINLVIDEQRGRRVRHGGRWLIDFASCNYLGLDLHPDVIAAVGPAIQQWGVHPSWTRAVASPRPYVELEQRLADLIGAYDTLVFPTVTLLHMGVLPRLTANGGTLLVDAEAHNSIQEAALLARARGAHVVVFPHDDVSALESELAQSRAGTRVIAIDGVYSMSGESPDLRRYQTLAERYDAVVYVDDAHGIGVLGSDPSASAPYGHGGGGVVRNQGVGYDRLVYVGGMSKAFSSMAAFISCTTPAERDVFRMSSSLVFSGPVPVASLASGIAALEVNAREGDALRSELYRLTKRLIDGTGTIGLVTDSNTYFPIVNVPLGSAANVVAACDVLWRHGIIITPSVFPAAPLGRGGVRFSITAANTDAEIDKALDALDEVAGVLRGTVDLIDLTAVSDRSGVQDLAR